MSIRIRAISDFHADMFTYLNKCHADNLRTFSPKTVVLFVFVNGIYINDLDINIGVAIKNLQRIAALADKLDVPG